LTSATVKIWRKLEKLWWEDLDHLAWNDPIVKFKTAVLKQVFHKLVFSKGWSLQ